MQKILEDANIKLASVASSVQGVSAWVMLEAMIRGETDAAVLADLAVGRLRSKLPELEAALHGRIRDHHRFMWGQLLHHLDLLNEEIATLDAQIRILTAPHEASIQRLDAIPGVDRRTAEVILAEIGATVASFPTAEHLASWACLCPGNNITGGKRRSGKTRRGQIGCVPPSSKPPGAPPAPRLLTLVRNTSACAPAVVKSVRSSPWHIPS